MRLTPEERIARARERLLLEELHAAVEAQRAALRRGDTVACIEAMRKGLETAARHNGGGDE